MELLEKHKLYLRPDKCEFEKMTVEYLGVIISHNSIAMDPVSSRSVFFLGFSGSNFIQPIPVVRGRQGKDQKYTKSSTN